MRKYDAVIFDLDGTLLDTSEGIIKSISHVMEKRSLPAIGEDVMRTFIGPPMQHSFARVFGMDKDEAFEAANDFRDVYKAGDLLLARPYDGIFDTIRVLGENGVKCGVATYKRQDYAEKILIHFGFDRVCDVMCGSDPEGKLTKKDIIENAAAKLSGEKSRAVMVGDSDNDAAGAKEAGIDFIGVTYGFGFASDSDIAPYPYIGCADGPSGILRYVI